MKIKWGITIRHADVIVKYGEVSFHMVLSAILQHHFLLVYRSSYVVGFQIGKFISTLNNSFITVSLQLMSRIREIMYPGELSTYDVLISPGQNCCYICNPHLSANKSRDKNWLQVKNKYIYKYALKMSSIDGKSFVIPLTCQA